MSRFCSSLCTTLCAFSLCSAFADIGLAPDESEHHEVSITETTAPLSAQDAHVVVAEVQPASTPAIALTQETKVEKKLFTPFTGKVKGKRVRMRLQPDIESRIIRELNKSDYLSVIGEKDNFWVVEPPAGVKAYVFRSFVLEGVIEGNRVNVRLEPSLDAPVIGHLNSGDHVDGSLCASNNKWYEIAPPSSTKFYVAKDFVEYAGGPDLASQVQKRQHTVQKLLDSAHALAAAEMDKPFDEIDIDRITQSYQAVINDYSDFTDSVEQAKEALASAQESYMQKRISHKEEFSALAASDDVSSKGEHRRSSIISQLTDKMKLWEPIEEALYLTWSRLNDDKNMGEFYDEQRLAAVPITGILEAYTAPVNNKPGDFVVRENDLPVAYVYSTQVNLQELVGKRVTVMGAPRPNNNFAFPAYYAVSVE